MNCEQMTLLLSAWLDGEVTAREEEQMQAHLERCPECRALLEQLQALHTSFSDLEEIPAPEGFAQSVMDRIEARSNPKVVSLFKRPQVRMLAGLAASVALFIGFSSVFPRGGSSEPAAAAPESAPAAVAYDYAADAPDEVNITAKSGEAPAPESPMEPEMEPAAGEPSAPAPEPTEAPAIVGDGAEMGDVQSADGAQKQNEARVILSELPEGLEDVLGQLMWEERVEDGAQCARLTAEQVEKLLELVKTQGLSAEQTVPTDGEVEFWTLVLQSN